MPTRLGNLLQSFVTDEEANFEDREWIWMRDWAFTVTLKELIKKYERDHDVTLHAFNMIRPNM